nr:hypothetical protein GCM10025699_44280 [Microbacterium flavescens]
MGVEQHLEEIPARSVGDHGEEVRHAATVSMTTPEYHAQVTRASTASRRIPRTIRQGPLRVPGRGPVRRLTDYVDDIGRHSPPGSPS